MLSFGADKVISSVRGGAIITNDTQVSERLRAMQKELPLMPKHIIIQHLLHPIVFFVAKPLYHVFIGKAMLWLAKHLRLISQTVSRNEKEGKPDKHFPSQFPNALSLILINQLERIEETTRHRKAIATIYEEQIHNPRVTLPVDKRNAVYAYLSYPILT